MDDIEQALEELYRSRYSRFEAVLATVTRDKEAARDAVQEAFAFALQRRRQFRGEGSLEGWVWKIALRVAAGQRRKLSGPLRYSLDPAVPEPELDAGLTQALRRLPPRRRLFVFLRYFADLSYDEIAQACGVRRGTVAAALARARAELAALVENETSGGVIR
ncbi:MAG: RNA polymerase sigma factor [Gaiellaceae bacterium]